LVQADLRRHELRQQLGELPQLQECGIRVIGKVALRQHAQTQELRVVLLQTGEVAGEKRRFMHHLVHVQPKIEYLWVNRSFSPKALDTATPDSHSTFCTLKSNTQLSWLPSDRVSCTDP
jgi:hypothetical protein